MTTIVTRAGKGSPLTWNEADANFNNLNADLDTASWSRINFNGENTVTIPPTAIQDSRNGENTVVIDTATAGTYAVRYASRKKTADLTGGAHDIADTLLNKYQSISGGFGWGRWDVMTSPLPVGSGYSTSPTATQNFFLSCHEYNPQNRYGTITQYQPEMRLYANPVSGIQIIAETQDFWSDTPGTSYGYNCAYNLAMSQSPFVSYVTNEHAKFMTGLHIQPNTIAYGGVGLSLYGYRDYITGIAIASGGSGYVVGDILTFNSGLLDALNENATVEVTSVSSGVITGARLRSAGGYNDTPPTTIGVTGGSGSSATFTWTMSAASEKQPLAVVGILGKAFYGIDMCINTSATHASFANAAIRIPNNNPIVAIATDGVTDVEILKVNSSNNPVIAGRKIIPVTAYTPTITSAAGTLTTTSLLSANYSQTNSLVTVKVAFQIVTKGTGTTAINLTLPVASDTNEASVGFGSNLTSGYSLSVLSLAGSTTMTIRKYDASDPIVDGSYYSVTIVYLAASV